MGRLSDLAGRRLYVDSNLFVYALEDMAPWDEAAKAVFDLIDDGGAFGVTSELTLSECLTKPFRDGNDAIAGVYLEAIGDSGALAVAPVSREVLVEAARLRATHPHLKTPDAVHVATAVLTGCEILITNDRRLRIDGAAVEVLLLSELKS